MAEDIVEKIRIEADASRANSEIGNLEKRLGGMFQSSAMKAVIFNKAIQYGEQILMNLGSQLKKGIADAMEYERTNNRLAEALRATGHEVGLNVQALNKQADEFERLTSVSDEVVRGQMAMAIRMGVTADKANDFVKAAYILGKTLNIDVNQAMKALVNADAGVLRGIKNLIPGFAELTQEQLASGAAVTELLKHQEILTSDMEGMSGSVNRLKTSWENMMESIGRLVTESKIDVFLDKLASGINKVTDAISEYANTPESGEDYLSQVATALAEKRRQKKGQELIPTAPESKAPSTPALPSMEDWQSVIAEDAKKRQDELEKLRGKPSTVLSGMMSDKLEFQQKQDQLNQDAFNQMTGVMDAELAAHQETLDAKLSASIRNLDADASLENQKNELFDSHLQYRIEQTNKAAEDETKIKENAAKRQLEVEKESNEKWSSMIQGSVQVVGGAFGTLLDDLISGSENAGMKFAVNILKGIGQMTFSKGVADMAAAVASGLIYGNWAGTGAASAEMAIGATLMAGGSLLGQTMESNSGGDQARGRPSQSMNAGASSGSYSGKENKPEQSKTINVYVNNAMTPAEVGVAVKRAIRAAEQQGLA